MPILQKYKEKWEGDGLLCLFGQIFQKKKKLGGNKKKSMEILEKFNVIYGLPYRLPSFVPFSAPSEKVVRPAKLGAPGFIG